MRNILSILSVAVVGMIGSLILPRSLAIAELGGFTAANPPPSVATATQTTKSPQSSKEGALLAKLTAEFEGLMAKKPPSEDSKERQLAKKIARKFAEKYTGLKSLSMEAEIYEIPKYKLATVKATMRRRFYTMKASFDGQLLYEQTFDHGKVSEHKLPFNGVPDQKVNYEVNKPEQRYGPLDVRLNDGVQFHMACNIGAFFNSWLGPENDMTLTLQQRLNDGTVIARETVDGFPCLVIFYKFPNDLPVAEKYYVDKKSFLLRKWVQFFDNDEDPKESEWLRVKHYYDIVAKDSEATTKPVTK